MRYDDYLKLGCGNKMSREKYGEKEHVSEAICSMALKGDLSDTIRAYLIRAESAL